MASDCGRTRDAGVLQGGGAGVRRPRPHACDADLAEARLHRFRHRRGRLEPDVSPWCRPRGHGECARRGRCRLGPVARRRFAREAESGPAAARRARRPLARSPSRSSSPGSFAETMCAVGSRSRSWRQTGASAGPSSRRDSSGAASRRATSASRSSSSLRSTLEHDDLACVTGDARGLEVKDRAVLWAQGNRAGFHA